MTKRMLFLFLFPYMVLSASSQRVAPEKPWGAWFFHPMETLAPTPACTESCQADDALIVSRLIKAYQHGAKSSRPLGNSMWQDFFNKHHLDIHKIVMQGSIDQVTEILRNPIATDLFYGFDCLAKSTFPIAANNIYLYASICLDRLVCFAEVIGAISLDKTSIPWKADDVMNRIEMTLGQQLSFPNLYPNERGLQTMRGVVSFRTPQCLYQAWRIRELLKEIPHPRVLEIGAGLGRTAYYARMFGIEDYTIVDIPITSLASGYFLARTLGDDQVLLFGESASDPERRVKFLSPEAFLSSTESYDLIINADSLTEMDINFARAYWKRIEANRGIFVSINHETNIFTVKDLIDTGTFINRIERTLYPMRDGYVEEVVRFIPR